MFGKWNTVFKRYRDWATAGVFQRRFDAVPDEPDMEYAMVDATIVVIAQHPRRASPLPLDAALYTWRHLIENFFGKLKEFKRIAMRADKTDISFSAAI